MFPNRETSFDSSTCYVMIVLPKDALPVDYCVVFFQFTVPPILETKTAQGRKYAETTSQFSSHRCTIPTCCTKTKGTAKKLQSGQNTVF